MVYRQNFIKCDQVTINEAGILKARGKIARIGIQNYLDEEGNVIRELRRPEEVEKSAEEFKLTPILLDHPSPARLIDYDDAWTFKGSTGNVDYVDGWLEADLAVTHMDAIMAAQTTHRYFSAGYSAELLDQSGVWIDELGVMGEVGKEYEYDKEQVNIKGNHVALVDTPRAGKGATFLDSGKEVEPIIISKDNSNNHINRPMVQIIHNDQVLTIEGNDAETVKNIVNELKGNYSTLKEDSGKTITALTSEKETLVEEKDSLVKEKSTLEAKVDSLEEAAKKAEETKLDADAVAKEVEARSELWSQVLPSLKDGAIDYKLDCMSIKKLYLKGALPNLAEKIDSADESYIEALWDRDQPTANSKTKVDGDYLKKGKSDRKKEDEKNAIEDAQAAYVKARSSK